MKTFVVGFRLPGGNYDEISVVAESKDAIRAALNDVEVRCEIFPHKVFTVEEVKEVIALRRRMP